MRPAPTIHLHGYPTLVHLKVCLALLACLMTSPGLVSAQTEGSDPVDSDLARQTFDLAWTRIADTYYDPDMRGLDWEGLRSELGPRAEAAESLNELRAVIRELLGHLGESHFVLMTGDAARALDDAGGPGGDADPGLELRLVDEGFVVTRVRPESAAAAAGVRPGWLVTGVADLDLVDAAASLRDAVSGHADPALIPLQAAAMAHSRLQGAEGSDVFVTFIDANGDRAEIELARSAPAGEAVRFGHLGSLRVEVSDQVVQPPDSNKQVGLIRMSSWFPTAAPQVALAVDRYRHLDGLIFDLRGNPGGVAALAMGIAGHVLDDGEELGEMQTRGGTLRFVTNPQRVSPTGERVTPYAGPVAILVDGMSASTSEIFAGGLQGLGRAQVFGETTPGQALPAIVSELPTGDRLMHAVADYTGPGGIRFEGRGVEPDVIAPWNRADLLAGVDPALSAALLWLRTQP